MLATSTLPTLRSLAGHGGPAPPGSRPWRGCASPALPVQQCLASRPNSARPRQRSLKRRPGL
eukprot:3066730-Pyramimonas_sp.AAC.1